MPVINSYAQNLVFRNTLSRLESQMAKLQRQSGSGLKADNYAELGGSVARQVLDMRDSIKRIDSYDRAISVVQGRLNTVSVALGDIKTQVTKIRDDAMQLDQSDSRDRALQQAAKAAITDLVSRLNSNVGGHFVFAGVEVNTPPMLDADTLTTDVMAAVTAANPTLDDPALIQGAIDTFFNTPANFYNGGVPTQPIEVSDRRTITQDITATSSAFTDAFKGLFRIALAPSLALPTKADFYTMVDEAIPLMQTSIVETTEHIGNNGTNQGTMDALTEQHEFMRTLLQTQDNDLTLVDYTAVVSRISELKTQLEVAFQTAGELRRLTLVNFL